MAVAIQRKKLIDNEQKLTHLLEKCNELDLRLSAREKIQFKPSSVLFMEHKLTNKGV